VRRRNGAGLSAQPTWRPVSAWWWILGAVIAVGITTTVVTLWLLAIAGHAASGTAMANARLDAVRTGLAAGGGAAAAVGLMLAFRRQHHQEVATVLADLDATERRITELYTKAAEELGSEKAAVRLAGLYALERLAQANPNHRQTVINVICAYLRMPFEPPPLQGRSSWHKQQLNRPNTEPLPALSHIRPGSAEELLVRITAQKIITDHLFTYELDTAWPRKAMPLASTFWPGVELDLTGAVLVDFTLQGKVDGANFTNSRFVGGANFAHAEFDGHVYFRHARFEGGSGHFYGAWFGLRAVFTDADFGNDNTIFDATTFVGMTFFGGARFGGGVSFRGARALGEFDTNWGSTREWPPGWTERSLAPDERITGEGRWEQPSKLSPPGNKWNVVVPNGDRLER
jgi:Pentapeptide repeats (9 copies)